MCPSTGGSDAPGNVNAAAPYEADGAGITSRDERHDMLGTLPQDTPKRAPGFRAKGSLSRSSGAARPRARFLAAGPRLTLSLHKKSKLLV